MIAVIPIPGVVRRNVKEAAIIDRVSGVAAGITARKIVVRAVDAWDTLAVQVTLASGAAAECGLGETAVSGLHLTRAACALAGGC